MATSLVYYLNIERKLSKMIDDITVLDAGIQKLATDFAALAPLVTSTLNSLSAKIGTATPDLTPEVQNLAAIDTAVTTLAATLAAAAAGTTTTPADDLIAAAVAATATVTPTTPSQTPAVAVTTKAPATVADTSASSDTAASTP